MTPFVLSTLSWLPFWLSSHFCLHLYLLFLLREPVTMLYLLCLVPNLSMFGLTGIHLP